MGYVENIEKIPFICSASMCTQKESFQIAKCVGIYCTLYGEQSNFSQDL